MTLIFINHLITNAFRQEKEMIKNPININEKFDKELFDKNQKANFYEYIDGKYTIVLAKSGNGNYVKQVFIDDCAVKFQATYYKEELTVKVIGQTLYSADFGLLKYYDRAGRFEKEIDLEAPYKYTLSDIANWIKENYDVDIFGPNKTTTSISRSSEPSPHYMFMFMTNEGIMVVYNMDALDGTIIFQNINEVDETLEENYFRRKYNKP